MYRGGGKEEKKRRKGRRGRRERVRVKGDKGEILIFIFF
jgi:hypothetical protein